MRKFLAVFTFFAMFFANSYADEIKFDGISIKDRKINEVLVDLLHKGYEIVSVSEDFTNIELEGMFLGEHVSVSLWFITYIDGDMPTKRNRILVSTNPFYADV